MITGHFLKVSEILKPNTVHTNRPGSGFVHLPHIQHKTTEQVQTKDQICFPLISNF